MPNHETMMLMTAEQRRRAFQTCYAIELGRAHADGSCRWPIEKLPEMVEKVMAGLYKQQIVSGPAISATLKFFQIKTQKQLWVFLDSKKDATHG